MNCKKFEALLQQLIESRQTELPPHCEDHVVGCAHCRTLWEQMIVLHCLIPVWERQVPEIDITGRVLSTLRTSSSPTTVSEPATALVVQAASIPAQPAPLSRRQGWAVIVMTIAVLVLTFQLMFPSRPAPNDQDSLTETPTVPMPGEDDPVFAEAEPQVGVDGFVKQAGEAYRSLGTEFVSAVADVSILFPSEITLSSLDESAAPDQNPNPAAPLTDHLKPVQQRLGKALDFLRDAVPTPQAPAT